MENDAMGSVSVSLVVQLVFWSFIVTICVKNWSTVAGADGIGMGCQYVVFGEGWSLGGFYLMLVVRECGFGLLDG